MLAKASYRELLAYRLGNHEISDDQYKTYTDETWKLLEPLVDLFARARSISTKMRWFRNFYPLMMEEPQFNRWVPKINLPNAVITKQDPLSLELPELEP